jgi:hypothetical protein
MKKKPELEADLDPVGTRHTRPGAKAAESAVANAKAAPTRNRPPRPAAAQPKGKPRLEADLDPVGTRHTRPGAKAAESAMANAKPTAARKRPKAR